MRRLDRSIVGALAIAIALWAADVHAGDPSSATGGRPFWRGSGPVRPFAECRIQKDDADA